MGKLAFILALLLAEPLAFATETVYRVDALELRSDNLTQKITLKAPDALSTTYAFILPNDDGASNQCLVTDGNGATSWAGPFALAGANTDITSLSRLFVSQTKTTTNSESLNQINIDLAPTANAEHMTSLYVNSNISTNFDIDSTSGVTVTTNANQQGDTGTINGVSSTVSMGVSGTPTEVGNAQTNYSLMAIAEDVTITGSASVSAGFIEANADTSIANVNGYTLGGTILGTIANGTGFNLSLNVDTVTGFYSAFNFIGTLTNINGLNAVNISPIIGAQDFATGWTTLSDSPNFTTLHNYIGYNGGANGDTIRTDYNFFQSGANITNIGRNVNLISIFNNFDEINGNYNGFYDGTNAGTMVGGFFQGVVSNVQASVPSSATIFNATPRITQRAAANQIVEITMRADVGGNLGGEYFRMCSAYSENPNECIRVWFDVDNGSTPPSASGDTLVEVDISEDDTASDNAAAAATVIDALTKWDASSANEILTVEVVANGAAGGVDTGGITNGLDWKYTQGGGGDGRLVGYQFSAGQSSGYLPSQIVAFDAGGYTSNFGHINAFTEHTLVESTPNPANVHVIGSNINVADAQTIANADVIGLGGIGQINIGAGSTLTSGGLGVGVSSAGKISLMQAGAGSTIQDVASDLAASVLVGGSGTFTNVTGYRAVQANFGASTPMTNYRAFYADAPAGPGASTNTWGLYANATFQHWMGGALKIGGTSGSTDQVTASGVKLDIEGGALRIATSYTPASSSEACAQGRIEWDADYVYVCTSTDTWKRTALSTW